MVRPTAFLTLAALGIVSPLAPVLARDGRTKDPPKGERPAASLKVGDRAPALKGAKWLQGGPVKTFQPGKVYVVNFWATWCDASQRFLPQLAALQARYKDRGVTVISFTCRGIRGEPGNTEARAAAFVKRRGPVLGYAFAYADDLTTADAWLKAAGQKGFCTFVVDQCGRIAYLGHPMFLPLVLPRVVAGGASAKAVGDEMARVVAEYQAVFAAFGKDPKAGLRAVKRFEAKYPALADLVPLAYVKLLVLPRHGKPGEAKAYAEALVAKAIKRKDVVLLELASSVLRDPKGDKELRALAVRAAQAHVRIDGGRDAQSLLDLADAYSAGGDKARAKEYARRAVAAAAGESADFRQGVEKEARRLGAEE